MKTYRALVGTVVRNSSVNVKFTDVLYKTDKAQEQKLLESDKRVSIYGAPVKAAKKVEAKVEPKEVESKIEEPKKESFVKKSKKK